MRTRAALLGAVASIALAGTANAGHFKGWYVGVEAGANWIEDADATIAIDLGTEFGTATTTGKGETELLVQTGDSVKEPQNRRATVDLQ